MLYVGCSRDVKARLGNHRSQSKWYGRMLHHKVRVYPTRAMALAVEERAIRLLHPEKVGLTPGKLIAIKRRNERAWAKLGFDVEAANALRKGDL